MQYLETNADKVSAELQKKIRDEHAYYLEGQERLRRDRSKMQMILDDKEKKIQIYMPNTTGDGNLEYHISYNDFQTAEFGAVDKNDNSKLFYNQSGVTNLVPGNLEIELMKHIIPFTKIWKI